MKKQQLFFRVVLFMLLLCFGNILHAQQNDYATNPRWIKMMDDPNVNYKEALKAFNEFWKNREKPREEKEVFGNMETKKEKKIKSPTDPDAIKYSFEYKKFLNWQREVAPYVQPDGRILSKEERLLLWEQEQKLREQAKAPQ